MSILIVVYKSSCITNRVFAKLSLLFLFHVVIFDYTPLNLFCRVCFMTKEKIANTLNIFDVVGTFTCDNDKIIFTYSIKIRIILEIKCCESSGCFLSLSMFAAIQIDQQKITNTPRTSNNCFKKVVRLLKFI